MLNERPLVATIYLPTVPHEFEYSGHDGKGATGTLVRGSSFMTFAATWKKFVQTIALAL